MIETPNSNLTAGQCQPALTPHYYGEPPKTILHDPQADDEPDQLAAARGIVIWVLISAVLLLLVKIIWFR
jgi:hypothetical protein